MNVSLHESDKVSEESDGPILHKGAGLEEVNGAGESSFGHLLVSLSSGESLLEGVDETSLTLVSGTRLVDTLRDIPEHILRKREKGIGT